MKWLVLALGILLAMPAHAMLEDGNRALSLEVRGKNGGFDRDAYQETRNEISQLVADGTIDRFSVYRYYSSGGFAACIELGATALTSRVRELQARFQRIPYDASTTAFYVGIEQHCR